MNITFVINTDGLEFDERVSKEAITLSEMGHRLRIIALEGSNLSRRGVTPYGVPYRTTSLWSRRMFPHRRCLLIKALEMHLRFCLLLLRRDWDVLWVHNHTSAGMLLYGWLWRLFRRGAKVVWDQHELGPERAIRLRMYHWLVGGCDAVVSANAERAMYLQGSSPSGPHDNIHVIQNFPGEEFSNAPGGPLPLAFSEWLGSDAYCVFQGVVHRDRRIFECVDAVIRCEGVKLLVLGPCEPAIEDEIAERWPDYRMKVHITGWTNPGSFPAYLDSAQASLVFYGQQKRNTWLCAPNRLYHAIARGIPIICGTNPTMRNIVERCQNGVVCQSNGDDPREVAEAIGEITRRAVYYRKRCRNIKNAYVWESQRGAFVDLLSQLGLADRRRSV